MASVTLTFSAAAATRIRNAITESLDLESPATVEDYKAFLVTKTKQFVRSSEKRVAEAAIAAASDVAIT